MLADKKKKKRIKCEKRNSERKQESIEKKKECKNK